MTKTALITALSALALTALSGASVRAAPADDLPDPPAPGTSSGTTPPPAGSPPVTSSPAAPPPAAGPPSAVPPNPAPVAPIPPTPPAAPSPPPPPPSDDNLPPLPRPTAPAAPKIDLPPEAATGAPAGSGAPDVELGLGRRSTLGGYGEGQLFIGEHGKEIEAKLRRFVIFLGHRFNDTIRLYSETEIEGGTQVELEQVYLDFIPDPHLGVRAGLILVPLGIINQLHEPPSYLTVDRPLTDQLIIPSTWRELGVGLFGQLGGGLSYQVASMTGLDPTGMQAEAPLVGARGNGRELTVHDPAFAGRLDFAGVLGLDVGAGGYLGWARGGHPELAGVRVAIAEGDVRYRHHGFDLRAEYAHMFVTDSYRLNDYFGLTGAQAIAARGRGYYVQAGYDLLRLMSAETAQELVLFAGYENVNARSRMSPYNFNPPAITGPGQPEPNAPSQAKPYLRAGLTYRPHPQVAIKLDVQIALAEQAAVAAPAAPLPGAPGVQRPIDPEAAEAAKSESRLGLALAFMF